MSQINSKRKASATVYHFNDNFIGLIPRGFKPRWPFDYEPVAEVVVSNLEQVFGLTQGNYLSKAEIAKVEWLDPLRPHRSTMIGDVVVIDTGEVVETWRCCSYDWELLDPKYAD
ncbi:MAG: hypothetical protein NXI32_22115 [bacterium]|nr:hypothetical protein [bacterium]